MNRCFTLALFASLACAWPQQTNTGFLGNVFWFASGAVTSAVVIWNYCKDDPSIRTKFERMSQDTLKTAKRTCQDAKRKVKRFVEDNQK